MNSRAIAEAASAIAVTLGKFIWHVIGRLVLFVLLVGVVLAWLMSNSTSRYSSEYGVPEDKIHIDAKPTACDWGHAPLGSKDCHFEKVVTPIRNDVGKVTDVYVSWARVSD